MKRLQSNDAIFIERQPLIDEVARLFRTVSTHLTKPSPLPIIFVVGDPGSGKTRLLHEVKKQLASRKMVAIELWRGEVGQALGSDDSDLNSMHWVDRQLKSIGRQQKQKSILLLADDLGLMPANEQRQLVELIRSNQCLKKPLQMVLLASVVSLQEPIAHLFSGPWGSSSDWMSYQFHLSPLSQTSLSLLAPKHGIRLKFANGNPLLARWVATLNESQLGNQKADTPIEERLMTIALAVVQSLRGIDRELISVLALLKLPLLESVLLNHPPKHHGKETWREALVRMVDLGLARRNGSHVTLRDARLSQRVCAESATEEFKPHFMLWLQEMVQAHHEPALLEEWVLHKDDYSNIPEQSSTAFLEVLADRLTAMNSKAFDESAWNKLFEVANKLMQTGNIQHAQSILEKLGENNPWYKTSAAYYLQLGRLYKIQGDLRRSLQVIDLALKNQSAVFKTTENQALINLKAGVLLQSTHTDECLDLLDRHVPSKKDENAVQWHLYRGHALRALRCFDEARREYMTVLSTSQILRFKLGQANAEQSLGIFFQGANQLNEAADYTRRAAEHFRQAGHRVGELDCDQTLAALAILQGDLATALHFYESSIAILRRQGIRRSLTEAFIGLGQTQCILGQLDSGMANLRYAWLQAEDGAFLDLHTLAHWLLMATEIRRQQWAAAEVHLQAILSIPQRQMDGRIYQKALWIKPFLSHIQGKLGHSELASKEILDRMTAPEHLRDRAELLTLIAHMGFDSIADLHINKELEPLLAKLPVMSRLAAMLGLLRVSANRPSGGGKWLLRQYIRLVERHADPLPAKMKRTFQEFWQLDSARSWSDEGYLQFVVRQAVDSQLQDRRPTPLTSKAEEVFIAESPAMRSLHDWMLKAAISDAPVLLIGESGSGKMAIAKRLHQLSTRKDRPLLHIDCATIPSNLMAAELFGYCKGAFTGAITDRAGLFSMAAQGTLVITNITELNLESQAMLLRVLQDGEFYPLASTVPQRSSARLIVTSQLDLELLAQQGTFRSDLLYRIAVLRYDVPPLRQRQDDIAAIVQSYLKSKASALQINHTVMQVFKKHLWPGNLRELFNCIDRALILKPTGTLDLQDLPSELTHPAVRGEESVSLAEHLEQATRALILTKLKLHRGNLSAVARALKVTRFALRRRMQRLSIKIRS